MLDNTIPKEIISNIDSCVRYFNKLIFGGSYNEENKGGGMDKAALAILPVLFESIAICDDDVNILLSEIEKYQTPQHFDVTKKRYEAIKEYYSGNQEACINRFKEALEMAKDKHLPEWLIQDILIDLRNQEIFFDESQNIYHHVTESQEELSNIQTPLYYPVLDRLDSKYYEGIIEKAVKYKTQSPWTVTFGNEFDSNIKSLASIYVIALYNGSLAHLQLLYGRIKYIAFYCVLRYSDWEIKKLLLKTTIMNGKQKEIDGAISHCGDLLSKLSAEDAYEIYSFAENKPLFHQRIVCKLEAFRITSYYMSEDKFNLAWDELYEYMIKWLDDNDSIVVMSSHIFPALEGSYLRIPQDQLLEVAYKCLHNRLRGFYRELFTTIRKCINFKGTSHESVEKFLSEIIDIIRSDENKKELYGFEEMLFTLRKQSSTLTEELDRAISEKMPSFYKEQYRLETETTDMSNFLESYIEKANLDNEQQGKNGLRFGNRSFNRIIKNILTYNKWNYPENLLDSAFKVACASLLKETQTIETKMDAIDLLVYLIKSQRSIKERNEIEIKKLLLNKAQIKAAYSMMDNLSETNLQFSLLILYECLGENVTVGFLQTLVEMADHIPSNVRAGETILNYLEAGDISVYNIQLDHVILQKAIEWSVESYLDIRWYAVQILFCMLRNREYGDIICNQLVKLMDNDNVYIKNLILRRSHLLKEIDLATYDYIIQKGSIDNNYAVRLVANEVQNFKEDIN